MEKYVEEKMIKFISQMINLTVDQECLIHSINTMNSRIEGLEKKIDLVLESGSIPIKKKKGEENIENQYPEVFRELADWHLDRIAFSAERYYLAIAEESTRKGFPISKEKVKNYFFETYKHRKNNRERE